MKDILRLHIPSNIKYTRLVEDFTRSAMEYVYPGEIDIKDKLCAVMNEVFVNIIKHSDTSKIDELVRIQFEIGSDAFLISIYDFGPGVKIKKNLPPYDKKYIGSKYEFRKVVDGAVFASVVNPYSLSFSFEQNDEIDKFDIESIDEVNFLQGHGFGVSIITKIMDSVTYSLIGDGKYEWLMIKNFNTKFNTK